MEQIMEFILNLLFINGKFLRTACARTVHGAIQRCIEYKSKLSMEYNRATQIIWPSGDNMLDFINQNSENYILSGEILCTPNDYFLPNNGGLNLMTASRSELNFLIKDLPVTIQKCKSSKKDEIPLTPHLKQRSTPLLQIRNKSSHNNNNNNNNNRSIKIGNTEDHLLDNLNAILKSQDFLFKNIAKMISLLEKSKFEIDANKMERIKGKLRACSEIINNSSRKPSYLDCTEDIVEEEIRKCRLQDAEIEDDQRIIQFEPVMKSIEPKQKSSINQIIDDAKVSSTASPSQIGTKPKSERTFDLELSKNLGKTLEINQRHFNDFEDSLWASTIRQKFLSLKDDHINRCKCAHLNKRHFLNLENRISKRVDQIEMEQLIGNDETKVPITTPPPQIGTKPKSERKFDLELSKNLGKTLEINQRHFNDFEDSLWASTIRKKFLSLKEDHVNRCKCVHINKRHFLNLENRISKRIDQIEMEQLIGTNKAMFHKLERKLVMNEEKREVEQLLDINSLEFRRIDREIQKKIDMVLRHDSFKNLLEQNARQFCKVEAQIKQREDFENCLKVNEANEKQFLCVDRRISAIKIDGFKMGAKKPRSETVIQPIIPTIPRGLTKTTDSPKLIEDRKVASTFLEASPQKKMETKQLETLVEPKLNSKSSQQLEPPKGSPNDASFLKISESEFRRFEARLRARLNKPINILSQNSKKPKKAVVQPSVSMPTLEELRESAKLLAVNQAAFKQLEHNLKTTSLINLKQPVIVKISMTSLNKRQRIDESSKKRSMSQISTIVNQQKICCIYQEVEVPKDKSVKALAKTVQENMRKSFGISRTFIKTRQQLVLKKLKGSDVIDERVANLRLIQFGDGHRKVVKKPLEITAPRVSLETTKTEVKKNSELAVRPTSSGHIKMRTTKAAMKKEQVLLQKDKSSAARSKSLLNRNAESKVKTMGATTHFHSGAEKREPHNGTGSFKKQNLKGDSDKKIIVVTPLQCKKLGGGRNLTKTTMKFS